MPGCYPKFCPKLFWVNRVAKRPPSQEAVNMKMNTRLPLDFQEWLLHHVKEHAKHKNNQVRKGENGRNSCGKAAFVVSKLLLTKKQN